MALLLRISVGNWTLHKPIMTTNKDNSMPLFKMHQSIKEKKKQIRVTTTTAEGNTSNIKGEPRHNINTKMQLTQKQTII